MVYCLGARATQLVGNRAPPQELKDKLDPGGILVCCLGARAAQPVGNRAPPHELKETSMDCDVRDVGGPPPLSKLDPGQPKPLWVPNVGWQLELVPSVWVHVLSIT